MSITAFPLQWPTGWKRTQQAYRTHGKFAKRDRMSSTSSYRSLQDLSISDGVLRVLAELQLMGVGRDDVVISTNVPLRLDGLPRSDRGEPGDPGAAVYWQAKGGAARVMAIDQYRRVADNLAAIAATLDALRSIERHGGAVILDRAFTGFTALPAPGAVREWWEVLGVERASATREGVKQAYRRLVSMAHPDRPTGSHAAMAELNAAQEAALLEVVQ